MLVAPASANTIAKMANGICDNLLTAVYLSARCPVMAAPAMDLDMWQNPATKKNIATLKSYGLTIIEPTNGELASGLIGKGRMAEPEELVSQLELFFSSNKKLKNKKALVTAGPTYEAIDPVRFIGNNSSGKMGFAIAEELANQGAEVTLVSGPTHLKAVHANITLKAVTSAEEMFEACNAVFPSTTITVLSAAVADYRPLQKADQKIKKTEQGLTIELTKTTDIAATLGKQKKNGQLLVGFALETENERSNAAKKITSKNFDLIVLNSLNDKGAGFGTDTNKVTIITEKYLEEFPLQSKQKVADEIVNAAIAARKN